MQTVIVVGGGAAGMMAAIKASNSDSIIEAILEEFAMPRDEKR